MKNSSYWIYNLKKRYEIYVFHKIFTLFQIVPVEPPIKIEVKTEIEVKNEIVPAKKRKPRVVLKNL